ncbi:MAG: FHA domain-containing protein [Pseudomonadota bacterium]
MSDEAKAIEPRIRWQKPTHPSTYLVDKRLSACCLRNAMLLCSEASCRDCGKPLLRCMAFAECGGIMSEDGSCAICIKPQLQIAVGASMKAAVGGAVAIPFELVNGSLVGRKMYVRSLWSREGGDWREERLGWESLEPEERKTASVTARQIDRPGLHEIEIMWVVATRFGIREEQYAYSTSVILEVPEAAQQAVNNIEISAEKQQGNVIEISMPGQSAGGIPRTLETIDMRVQRQEIEERRMGLRGMSDGKKLARTATFQFIGFAQNHAPDGEQAIVSEDAMLVFGRDYTRNEGGNNDIRLLVMDQKGVVDENLSRALSRRHFEIYIENDRLALHVAARFGLKVNDQIYSIDSLVTLSEGDVIAPIISDPDALKLHVTMRRQRDTFTKVIFTRIPSSPEPKMGQS